ncbi:PAS domain S-box protein [uncultured Methanoregula sp.]|uniref:PAS domain S-box protein n=1 Tax=uncultured Methanoregula sp. TaxID=1005933 RepID=UPI002AAB25DD|nr:PAS domain S-box protein [uncultured Methanoregula sp.]
MKIKKTKLPAKNPEKGSRQTELTVEETIRQSEKSYHDLFNTIQQAIYIHNPDGTFDEVNAGACAMYGYSREEFIGKTPEFLSAPKMNDVAVLQEKMQKAFAGEPQQLEFWGKRKNGEVFPKEIKLSKGTYFGKDVIIAIATDISQKKQVEEEQKHKTEILQRTQRALMQIAKMPVDDLDGFLKKITEIEAKTLDIARVSIWWLTRDHAEIICADAYEQVSGNHNSGDRLIRRDFPRYFKALDENRTIAATDARTDKRTAEFTATYLIPFGITAMMDVPVRRSGTIIGVMCHEHQGTQRAWDLIEQDFAASVSDHIVSVIEGLERRSAEKALRESEERYRTLIEAVTDYIFTVRIESGQVTETTHGPGCEAVTGYTTRDFDTDPGLWLRMVVEEDRPGVILQVERILAGKEVQAIEHRIVRKDGGVRWVRNTTVPHYNANGSLIAYDGLIQDITGRKRDEQALRESEGRYSAIFSNSYSVSLLIDPDTGMIVDANDAAVRYYGYSRDQLTSMGIFDLNRLPEKKVLRNLQRAKDEKEKQFFSTHYLADGSRRYVEVYSGPIRVSGKPLFYSIIHDITERKLAEQALRESEAMLNVILQSSPIPKFVIDTGHRVISWNKALEETSGIKARDVKGTNRHWAAFYNAERPCLADLIVEGDEGKIAERYKDMVKKSDAVEGAYEATDFFPSMGSTGKWLHFIAAPVIDPSGKVIGAVETLEDITPLVKAQQELKESEERYSSLFTNSYSVSLLIDPDTGLIIDANDAAVRYYGYSRYQLKSIGIFDLNRLPKEKVIRNLQRAKDQKEKHFHTTHYRADGETRFVEVFSGPIRVQGKPLFYSIIHDITDRRLAETALQESEERYRTLIDQLPDYVIVHRDGILLYVNPAGAFRLGYNAESLIGQSIFPFIAPECRDNLREKLSKRMAGIEIPSYELKIVAKDNTIRTVLVNGATVSFEGKPASLNVLSDITAIKMAEESIRYANEELEKRVAERTNELSSTNDQLISEIAARAKAEADISRSLEEKDLLLREIHHRVKNNLQIIASLLNLQSRYITDEKVLESIRDSQSRVRAMALVHERIYRSHNISDINLKEYLNYLTKQIFQFYNIRHNQVAITITMDEITADIDTLIPAGLILNELVSNSLKHAFPEGRKGIISIECERQESNTLRFIYHDDGAGLPPGFDWKNTESLGLRLVNNLVDQLNGTIDLSEGNGTTFIITLQPKRDQPGA